MTPEAWAKIERRIRGAARMVTRNAATMPWREDFEQELRLRCLEAGDDAATFRMNFLALNIVREWFGMSRFAVRSCYWDDVDTVREELIAYSPIPHEARIAWHRLATLWPTLTGHQKAGIYTMLTDEPMRHTSEKSGRELALAKVNAPRAFRARKYATHEELEAAQVEARKAWRRKHRDQENARRNARRAAERAEKEPSMSKPMTIEEAIALNALIVETVERGAHTRTRIVENVCAVKRHGVKVIAHAIENLVGAGALITHAPECLRRTFFFTPSQGIIVDRCK
jgi:hypothetical protein